MVIIGKPGAHGRSMLVKLAKRLLLNSSLFTIVVFLGLNLAITPRKDLLIYAGLVVALALTFYLGRGISRDYMSYQQYKSGVLAERSVYKKLRSLGPELLVNGASFPSIGDCDHIVINGSLYLIETKAGRGKVDLIDGKIYINGKAMPRDPLKQIERQARIIKEQFGITPRKIICITHALGSLMTPDTLITNIEGLKTLKSPIDPPLDQKKKEEILNFFKK